MSGSDVADLSSLRRFSMPVPIVPVNIRPKEEPRPLTEPGQYHSLDWAQLDGVVNSKTDNAALKKVSDSDAGLFFKFWKETGVGDNEVLQIDGNTWSDSDILRLKALGFIAGGTESAHYTSRGKEIIRNMVLSEQNSFSDQRVEKPYSEILAEMDKRKKQGIRLALGKPKAG